MVTTGAGSAWCMYRSSRVGTCRTACSWRDGAAETTPDGTLLRRRPESMPYWTPWRTATMPRSGPGVSAKKPPARYDCDASRGCSSSPARGLIRRVGCQCPLSSLGSWRTHPNPWPGIDRRHMRSSFSPLIYFQLCARDGFSSPLRSFASLRPLGFLPQINKRKKENTDLYQTGQC